jgi:uncharacterized membrane protein YfcA
MIVASLSTPWQVAGTILVGVATGVLSGMFGIGGAVISTPAIRALGATPLEGVGSTLPSIIPSSITGTLRYQRDGLVDWYVVRWTGAFGVVASVAGAWLADKVPGGGHVLMIATAMLVGFTAYRTARPRVAPAPAPATDTWTSVRTLPDDHEVASRREWWRLGLIGLGAGGLSGLLGVGGGVLMVPAFSNWVHMNLKATIATSLAIVGIVAVPGTIIHALLGHIAWRFAIPLSIGVIPGARLGAHVTIHAPERTLRITVGVMLGIVAVIYGLGEVLAL